MYSGKTVFPDVLAPWRARPSTYSELIIYLNVSTKVSVSIHIPFVSCICMWSSLCLWMYWSHGCQAICRHCVDVTISTRTRMNIVVAVSSIRMWSLFCLWMSCLQSCQAFHKHSADHSTEYYCFIRVPVATCTLINIVAPVWCIWMWSLLCLWMYWPMVARPSADTVLITQLDSVCQVFSICMYFRRHCGSCIMLTNVIFWLCLLMSCPHGRWAICRHSADHSTG